MKNLLLAVVGLSPQVITETLFELHQQRRSIDAIHVITTRQGKEKINAQLLSPADGKYYEYLKEYRIDPATIDFGFHSIHTIKDPNGIEIDDIAGEEENEWLLKKCMELSFAFTRDQDTAVLFSIAGGRKTMSACLMVAAQFYGRSQDRVYHVLVSPEFESNRDFFYPRQKSVNIKLTDRNSQPYYKETKYARLSLVPIPFVSIRDRLGGEFLREPLDPPSLMQALVREQPYWLTVDLLSAKLSYKNLEMELYPAQFALYAFFAQQKKTCTQLAKACRGCTDCYLERDEVLQHHAEIAAIYRKVAAGSRPFEEMSDSGILGLSKENFNSYRSKISDALRTGFGLYALKEIEIQSVGKKPGKRYGIPIDREKVRIIS